MRWKRGHRSADVIDSRGKRGRRMPGGRRGGLGLGGLALLFLISVIFKQDFFTLVDAAGGVGSIGGGGAATAPASPGTTKQNQERFEFVSFVLDDVQDTWEELLPRMGQRYQRAQMEVFEEAVRTACGIGRAASGPFYCPGDQKVYLDLSFFDELHHRFDAPGDFAQAYVVAHEVGHHVQHVLGIERQVRQMQRQRPNMANELSVRMELQADCLAGVWAHSARRELLEPGDVEEGMGAAAAVGDDRIQERVTGYVNPDAFTHGTAEQRVRWFRRGLDSGDPDVCDPFASDRV